MKTRKIIVQLAMSADGYIARPDGDVEWLNRRARLDYGLAAFSRTVDTVLLGRKTYDWAMAYCRKHRIKGGIFDRNKTNYVFSRKPPKKAAPGVEFVRGPVKAFARRLRAKPGKHIWMMGGGELIASFLDAGEIDEFDIHVIPVMIGKGIPLVAPRKRDVWLRLRSSKKYRDGVVRVRYEVAQQP
jgi:dihydrofolate reductase